MKSALECLLFTRSIAGIDWVKLLKYKKRDHYPNFFPQNKKRNLSFSKKITSTAGKHSAAKLSAKRAKNKQK